MNKNKKRGFTLVELLVVIAILAILATVSILGYTSFTKKAKQSNYLALARQTMDASFAQYTGELEQGTLFFVQEEGVNVGWFKYENGSLTTLSSQPEIDIDHAYPMDKTNTDFMPDDVVMYRPLVKHVVDKLNALLTDASATTYEKLADAGKVLTDQDMDIINWGRKSINLDSQLCKYSFAYALSTNKVFITNTGLTEVKYSTSISSIPTDKRILTGVNINTAQDFLDFSTITNIQENGNPTEKNIYVNSNTKKTNVRGGGIKTADNDAFAPLVLLNLNNDINICGTGYTEISFWYAYSGGNDGSKYNDIQLLFNGNNNTITSSSSIIGSLRTGSIIRNLTVEYVIGTSTEKALFSDKSNSNYPYNNDNNVWHSGLLVDFIITHNDDKVSDVVIFDDIKFTGKIYMNQQGKYNSMGFLVGYYVNDWASANSKLKVNNVELFTDTNDVVDINFYQSGLTTKKNDAFGTMVGVIGYERNVEITNVNSINLTGYANHYGQAPNIYSKTLFGNVETY